MKQTLLILIVFGSSISILLAQDCIAPEITSSSGAGVYCEGEEVVLSIEGNLNDATEWNWYIGRCSGQSIGTGTSITISVEESLTYFVRGTGGCVANGASCNEILVKLDDIGPDIVTCPTDIIIGNDMGLCGASVTYELPTGSDNCSDEIEVKLIDGLASGDEFPVGITLVTYELVDNLGNSSTCTFSVTVEDNEPPGISCPASIEIFNDPGECGAIVIYDLPVGIDNCEGSITVQSEGLGSGSFFPVGVTVETYTVTDLAGNEVSCSFEVLVTDNEPPVITVSDKTHTMWPPNHKAQSFEISDQVIEVWDNCGGVSIEDVVVGEATSDELQNDKGDGNTVNDIVISDDCKTVSLLSERRGDGNGRVYTVHLALKDLHGNIGTAMYTVAIPHDKGKKNTAIDDGPIYQVSGCDLSSEEFTGPTIIENSSRVETAFSTFPNPYTDRVEVEFKSEHNDIIHIELYSLNGNRLGELMKSEVREGEDYQWELDLSAHRNNVFLMVLWGEKTYSIKRIQGK